MFLTEKVNIDFDGLSFCVKVPDNRALTALFEESDVLTSAQKITPSSFEAMAAIIEPCVVEFPDIWAALPEITRSRLLFELAKYVLNESLTVPELKKK